MTIRVLKCKLGLHRWTGWRPSFVHDPDSRYGRLVREKGKEKRNCLYCPVVQERIRRD